jgi:hypothetical protein
VNLRSNVFITPVKGSFGVRAACGGQDPAGMVHATVPLEPCEQMKNVEDLNANNANMKSLEFRFRSC